MAIPGQRFELDLESDDFAFKPSDDGAHSGAFAIKEIKEHEPSDVPLAPTFKSSTSGFPEHKFRHNLSQFKRKPRNQSDADIEQDIRSAYEPSDRAIRQQVGKKYGADFEAQQKAEISEENKRRLAEMSTEDVEDARAELLGGLSPELMERLLKRANIDEDSTNAKPARAMETAQPVSTPAADEYDIPGGEVDQETQAPPPPTNETIPEGSSVHFPLPPRPASSYKPLDPNSATFLTDLRSTYFPELPHDPTSMSWLKAPTQEDEQHSSYNPNLSAYPASSLRFDFNGRLVSPSQSLEIPVSAGLHHHGDAPSSAGYTVPELTLLARSAMPNQRCMAYQTTGRVLYKLGKGDFGTRGSEVEEAIWDTVEHERIVELIMAEANKQNGHASARAYATEALWLWRKGGGSDRGLLKPNEKRAA